MLCWYVHRLLPRQTEKLERENRRDRAISTPRGSNLQAIALPACAVPLRGCLLGVDGSNRGGGGQGDQQGLGDDSGLVVMGQQKGASFAPSLARANGATFYPPPYHIEVGVVFQALLVLPVPASTSIWSVLSGRALPVPPDAALQTVSVDLPSLHTVFLYILRQRFRSKSPVRAGNGDGGGGGEERGMGDRLRSVSPPMSSGAKTPFSPRAMSPPPPFPNSASPTWPQQQQRGVPLGSGRVGLEGSDWWKVGRVGWRVRLLVVGTYMRCVCITCLCVRVCVFCNDSQSQALDAASCAILIFSSRPPPPRASLLFSSFLCLARLLFLCRLGLSASFFRMFSCPSLFPSPYCLCCLIVVRSAPPSFLCFATTQRHVGLLQTTQQHGH